jgi:hypothetical protein
LARVGQAGLADAAVHVIGVLIAGEGLILDLDADLIAVVNIAALRLLPLLLPRLGVHQGVTARTVGNVGVRRLMSELLRTI